MDVRGWVRESGTCAMSRRRCDQLSRGARAAAVLLARLPQLSPDFDEFWR